MLPILTPLTWLPHQLVCMLSAEVRFCLEHWTSLKPWWWWIIGDQIIDAEVFSSTIVDLTFFPAGKSHFWEALDKVWGLIIAGATAPAIDVQCYIILKGAAKSLTPLHLDFQELNSALTEYLEQSTPLGYSTIFKIWGRPCIFIHNRWSPEIYILGETLHSCTWLSKSWNNQIGAGGPIFWYN